MTAPDFRILAVCTGNICRSPFIERLLVLRLRERLGEAAAARFVVGSAGTGALVGDPMSPDAADTLIEYGADPSGFTGRDVTRELVSDADLVLTATREHRGRAVTLDPRASSRTMTLREFARLLSPLTPSAIAPTDPVERMTAIAVAARGNRGLVPLGNPVDDDIADPYGRERAAYDAAAQQIDEAVTVIIDLLAPRPS